MGEGDAEVEGWNQDKVVLDGFEDILVVEWKEESDALG